MDRRWIDLRILANSVLFYEFHARRETDLANAKGIELNASRQALEDLNTQVANSTATRDALLIEHLQNRGALTDDEMLRRETRTEAALDMVKAAQQAKNVEVDKMDKEFQQLATRIKHLTDQRNNSEATYLKLVDAYHNPHWVTVMESADVTTLRMLQVRRARFSLMFCLGGTVKTWGIKSIKDLAEEIGAGTVGPRELFHLENGKFSKVPRESCGS
ncbi:hypothetical protein ABFX02_13G145000 [Erythranthe guttata]|uniref:uncharacterized protein LOC105968780 isoform X2 n=1 Tax=Erythranthe guttata TaxID=4155 RepID=UPI00064D9D62|nr:PREDICTED: uncharacterized protein LOC105968780 isoform X2 [Erythranthe guttata]|eukprot:XP_012848901.1 PREDICTED: uncharacterized protein LOC105968780 isoform X2 [Erythranthe guttata]